MQILKLKDLNQMMNTLINTPQSMSPLFDDAEPLEEKETDESAAAIKKLYQMERSIQKSLQAYLWQRR